jgi:glycosyltransferase involved in cell wall biosynthesis
MMNVTQASQTWIERKGTWRKNMNISEITVIVSVKNQEKHIPRFLASLPPEVKVCLVDVGSDETADLAMKLRSENTTIIRHQARIQEARNYASVYAQTRWLLFTQANTAFAADTFSHLAKINPRGALYGAKERTGKPQNFFHSISGWASGLSNLGIPMVSGAVFLVEKYIFHAVGGFNPRSLAKEDAEIGFQIKRAGYPIRFDPGLRVFALAGGQPRKNAMHTEFHSLMRCVLIYFSLNPGGRRNNHRGTRSAPEGR